MCISYRWTTLELCSVIRDVVIREWEVVVTRLHTEGDTSGLCPPDHGQSLARWQVDNVAPDLIKHENVPVQNSFFFIHIFYKFYKLNGSLTNFEYLCLFVSEIANSSFKWKVDKRNLREFFWRMMMISLSWLYIGCQTRNGDLEGFHRHGTLEYSLAL